MKWPFVVFCLNLAGSIGLQAAASFGGEVGRYSRTSADDSDVYILASGISAGKRAVAFLGWEASSDQSLSEVRDSKGNLWTVDAAFLNNSVHQLAIASAYISSELAAGDTITISYTLGRDSDRAATIIWLDGVAESGQPDAIYEDGFFNTDVLDTINTSTPGAIIIGQVQAQQWAGDLDLSAVTYTNSLFQMIGESMDFGYDPGSTVGLRNYMFWNVTDQPGGYSPGGIYLEAGQPHDESYSCLMVSYAADNTPKLVLPSTQLIDEQTPLNAFASVPGIDGSVNLLTFGLISPPDGMTIDATTGAIAWTPSEAQGPSTNEIAVTVSVLGILNLNLSGLFQVIVNEVNTAPTLTLPPDQVIDELTPLNVVATASDSDQPANTLTFALVSPPDGMTIDPITGAIAWTPSEAQGPSTNQITVTVTDDGVPNLNATASFQVVVHEVNTAPTLTLPPDQVIDESTPLRVLATASDSDQPVNTLTFALVSPPSGMTIDPITGAIAWTPSEAQGPSTNQITVTVTDDGVPNLTARGSFQVVVNEVNTAPKLILPSNRTINEVTPLNVFVSATDSDRPANSLTFGLVSPPAGMTIDAATGAISWIPLEAQGPSTNVIIVTVTDDGLPNLTTTGSFQVVVNEVNMAPRLILPSDQIIDPLTPLNVIVSAIDIDIPANGLTYGLVSPPEGMTIDAITGAIAWTPTDAQAPSTNQITVTVTDNGVPNLTTTGTFQALVVEVNPTPALTLPSIQVIDELTPLHVFAGASDAHHPTNTLTFGLVSAPDGMTIDAVTGAIDWTPTEAQGPNTYTIAVFVQDTKLSVLTNIDVSVTNTFVVQVNEVNSPPSLIVPPNAALHVGDLYSGSASATDPDLPPNSHLFSLASGPQGLTVSASGQISWSTANVAPGDYPISIHVVDDGIPALGDTASFTISVQNRPQLSLQTSSAQNSLMWTAIAGTTYRVQFKEDLDSSPWNDLPGDVTAEAGTASKIDETIASAQTRFYRIIEIQR